MNLDDQTAKLGFSYRMPALDLSTVTPGSDRAYFRAQKAFEQIIFDTVKLEGNPYTFPEVKTLLEGITVGEHKLSDQNQILNQAASWNRLFALVQEGRFALTKEVFCELHALAGKEEALSWGVFRDDQVAIAGTDHKPPPHDRLDHVFETGLDHIDGIENPIEQGMAFFLFGSLNQFFWDVNKRTSRLMMNGILLSAGFDVINIPAKRRLEFNKKMIRFYEDKNGTEMMDFLLSCSLDEKLHPVKDNTGRGPR